MPFKKSLLLTLTKQGKKGFIELSKHSKENLTPEKALGLVNEFRKTLPLYEAILKGFRTEVSDVKQETFVFDGVETTKATPLQPNDKAILYIHGGAFFIGLLKLQKHFAANVAQQTQATVFTIDYRLAPEHPFPAALEDTLALYQHLLKQGYDPKKIIVMGDSAGGNLTLSLLLKLKELKLPLPGAAIPISPATDMLMTGESHRTRKEVDPILGFEKVDALHYIYLREASPENPLVSPLYGDLTGLPPLLIMVGGNEILLDDSLMFAAKAKEAGVDVTLDVVDDMFHVYPTFYDMVDEAKVALGKMSLFIKMKTD